MRLRSRITIGTLGFLLISLTLCCTLMIYVSKKNMLNSTTSYTKTELEKLVANFYTNKSDIESTVEELTAETKLKYYFFKQTQYSDSDTEYVLQCGDEIIYNDSGLDAPTILGLNEDKSNVEIQGETKSDIVHTEGADYYICGVQLKDEADAISQGQYQRQIDVKGKDELASLSHSFNTMAKAVESHIAEVEETSEARNRLIHALSHEMRTPVTQYEAD